MRSETAANRHAALRGREAELARIDRLLVDAVDGRSGTLVLAGGAGAGKSALLAYARERAGDRRVLHARGVESESELAFSALDELLRPVLDRLPELPRPQGDALRGALALAASEDVDRFAVSAAALSLLASAAEDGPVLCVVDDAQWVDAASAEALAFCARRLNAEGITLIMAVRDDGETLLGGSGALPVHTLAPLDDAAARAVLLDRVDGTVAPDVFERLLVATDGNPLALQELPGLLRPEQLAGSEPLPDPLPTGRRLESAFLPRVEALPGRTQTALLVAAASDTGDTDVIVRAAEALGADAAAFEAAELAGLVEVRSGSLCFAHSLVRSAVYHGASPPSRRAAHRALASALDDERHADRRAWQLAQAALGPDEAVAAALEAAAELGRRRGGAAAEARALEQAARLTPDLERRGRRLFAAARAASETGRIDWVASLADSALAVVDDPLLQADIARLRGWIYRAQGDVDASQGLLLQHAERLEQVDPDRAADLLAAAAVGHLEGLDAASALRLAERAWRLGWKPGGRAEFVVSCMMVWVRILRGQSQEGVQLARRCVAIAEDKGNLQALSNLASWLVNADELVDARRLLEHTLRQYRDTGAVYWTSWDLDTLAELECREGRFTAAYAHALEATQLAEELTQPQLAYSLGTLAFVEATLGRADDCRAHAERALLIIRPLGERYTEAHNLAALGRLALGEGRHADVVAHLGPVARMWERGGVGEPSIIPFAPDLIEAYIRLDQRGRAERELGRLEAQARATERRWALAAAARCRGFLADDESFDAVFEEAFEWHAPVASAYEVARTQLVYGERLARAGRIAEAQDRLREALDVFQRLGATPHAERTREALGQAGAAPKPVVPQAVAQLTPQELQVALAVVEGATNREVAAQLFLSTKTVEYHLRNIFRKLNLRSRAGLARRLVGEPSLLAARPRVP